MAAEVVDWVDSAQPDIVLLHAGANDVLQATVGPINDDATQERADAFNAAILDVVAARAGQGEPVYFVDNTNYIQPSDVRDDSEGDYYHLTHSGNAKMAAGWYGALTDTEPKRYEAENPNYTTVHNATQLDTENASNYGKVGELDADDSYLEFTVEAPADDVYRTFVRGGNGTGETCTQTLTVNDREPRTLEYESYGWETWTMTAKDVWLQPGANTIRFAHDTCSAEIDSIDIVRPN